MSLSIIKAEEFSKKMCKLTPEEFCKQISGLKEEQK